MTQASAERRRLLSASDHRREYAGYTYVYPVVSRRAGGISIGINLNPNNACNWRCIYCQVPGLVRGAPPPVALDKLRLELTALVQDVVRGDFLSRHVPEDARRLNDIALSGNGEPTSAREFDQVIALIADVRRDAGVPNEVKTVLITNGSLMHRPIIAQAVGAMAQLNGEVWFKLDRATDAGMRKVNNTRVGMARVKHNLKIAAGACRTWIQTCVFLLDGTGPSDTETAAYLDFLKSAIAEGLLVEGVLLYGLARQSFQPEATRLSRMPEREIEDLGKQIRALGLVVKIFP
jgi:wyosine [tRNA(Phe)-imidazoG37] synthetase (radical SAM superfamily)